MNLLTKQCYTFAKIGFVGLGNMGMPMAVNLAKNGHQVFGYDVDAGKKDYAKQNKIDFHTDIVNVAKNADVFVAMLPNSQHSKNVCESDSGLFKNAKRGSLIIDCSTISPMVAEQLNNQSKKHGMNYVDAPVSGGVTGAAAGTLTFMVGAENQEIFNKCKPVLEGMGKNFFNCSKSSGGQIAKLCNNMALAVQMIGIAEALAMGKKLGMDERILANIMKVSTSRCWSVDTYNPIPDYLPNTPACRNYDGGFACDLMLKDLKLAIEASEAGKLNAELGRHAKQIYEKLSKAGMGKKDFGIIYDKLIN